MTWIGMRSLAYRGSGRPETLHASRARGHIIARRCSGVVLPLRSSLGSAPRRNTRMGNACRAAARATRGEDTPNYTAVLGRAGGSRLRPSARSGRHIDLTNGDGASAIKCCWRAANPSAC